MRYDASLQQSMSYFLYVKLQKCPYVLLFDSVLYM